jgi:hypothetical protein
MKAIGIVLAAAVTVAQPSYGENATSLDNALDAAYCVGVLNTVIAASTKPLNCKQVSAEECRSGQHFMAHMHLSYQERKARFQGYVRQVMQTPEYQNITPAIQVSIKRGEADAASCAKNPVLNECFSQANNFFTCTDKVPVCARRNRCFQDDNLPF